MAVRFCQFFCLLNKWNPDCLNVQIQISTALYLMSCWKLFCINVHSKSFHGRYSMWSPCFFPFLIIQRQLWPLWHTRWIGTLCFYWCYWQSLHGLQHVQNWSFDCFSFLFAWLLLVAIKISDYFKDLAFLLSSWGNQKKPNSWKPNIKIKWETLSKLLFIFKSLKSRNVFLKFLWVLFCVKLPKQKRGKISI